MMTPDAHQLSEGAKVLAPFAAPIVKKLIDAVVSPALTKIWQKKELTENLDENKIREHFRDYLTRTFSRLSFINTLVFPNQQTRLIDIYIPLTVVNRSSGQEHLIEGWSDKFIPLSRRVLITDTAGMGKSTLLKRMFLETFDCQIKIPLFIELKSLNSTKGILDKLLDDLGSYDHPFPKDLLIELLKRGELLIYLDGYDEIPLEHKESVTRMIQDFVNRCFENWFVISSRSDPALSALGEFQAFSISPLKRKEAYKLLQKYDRQGSHAKALIAELDGGKYEQVKDLLRNPMLVSLLFKAYTFKAKVPFRKHIFYRQVFDALFEAHDFTKGESFSRPKHCGLDIDDFHSVLRELGFSSAKVGRIDLSKDKILDLLTAIRSKRKDITFQPADFLLDLISTVPLFACEGSEYNWAHKSVQDYFASQFIYMDARKEQKSILTAIYNSESGVRFANVIDLLHDTDPELVRHILIRKLLQDFVVHYDTSYKESFRGVLPDDLDLRRRLTFGYTIFITAVSHDDIATTLPKGTNPVFSKHRKLIATAGFSLKNSVVTIFHRSNSERLSLTLMRSSKPGVFLVNVLAAKKYEFTKKIDYMEKRIAPEELPPNKPVIVDDDPGSPLNSELTFKKVTSVLSDVDMTLDYAAARRFLAEIDRELAAVADRDPLTNGI